MSKAKIDFISELLANKKLDSPMKQKLFELAAKEFQSIGLPNNEIIKRLEEIEKKLGITADKNNIENLVPAKPTAVHPIPTKKNELPNYIDPKHLYVFLKDYNADPILKTTCHEIDTNELLNIINFCKIEEYDFIKHKEKVQERFLEMVNNKKYFIDYKIKNLIYVYTTGKTYNQETKGWTDDDININWNSESLEKWSQANKNKIPHPDSGLCYSQGGVEYEIRPSINTCVLGQKKLRSFSDLILHFKYLFHLRSDNSLLKIIERINIESEFWKNKVQFEIDNAQFPENLEFFTNVEKLVQAYKILINLILDVTDKNQLETPIVKLSLVKLFDGMEFCIHHKNSVFKKSTQDTINREGQTMTNLIKNQINGLCDFYIKADFGNNQYGHLNIWDKGRKSGKVKSKNNPLDFFEGVEYILKFRK
jgi:hypothetical protein